MTGIGWKMMRRGRKRLLSRQLSSLSLFYSGPLASMESPSRTKQTVGGLHGLFMGVCASLCVRIFYRILHLSLAVLVLLFCPLSIVMPSVAAFPVFLHLSVDAAGSDPQPAGPELVFCLWMRRR